MKIASLDFFHKRNESRDGLKSSCKLCLNNKNRDFFIRNSEEIKERAKLYRAKNKKEISQSQKKWRLENKDWIENYNNSHKKEACEKSKRYRDSLSVDKKKELYRKQQERTRKWKNDNPSYMANYLKKYREVNREKIASYLRNYKARKKNSQGSHTGSDIIDIIKKQNNLCFWCSIQLKEIHIDHYIPLFSGGSNDKSNLVASCPKCNQSKGRKMPHEFIAYQQQNNERQRLQNQTGNSI
jgi:5-methylcytosine-specific restriction endonuclease McrA